MRARPGALSRTRDGSGWALEDHPAPDGEAVTPGSGWRRLRLPRLLSTLHAEVGADVAPEEETILDALTRAHLL